MLTPKEKSEIRRNEAAKVSALIAGFALEEAVAWLSAYRAGLDAEIDRLELAAFSDREDEWQTS
jgi:hypothetical protein